MSIVPDDVMAIVLGGGKGERLFPLTQYRSKPAVPLAGKYRIVDIPLSNCINSNIRRIFVLTQFNSASLNRHLARTYRFDILFFDNAPWVDKVNVLCPRCNDYWAWQETLENDLRQESGRLCSECQEKVCGIKQSSHG